MINLFAAEERAAKRDRLGDPLKVLDRAIDFAALAAADARLDIGGSGRDRRPPYPPVADDQAVGRAANVQPVRRRVEYQVLDRTSFQRFARLEKTSRIPDAKTDGGVARAAEGAGSDRRHQRSSGPAVGAVRLYRAWRADHRREHRHGAGAAQPQRKGTAGCPISAAQQRRNRRIAKQRAFGEHPFARLAQMGGKHLRTIGLARAKVIIGLKVIAHNLVHLARLKHKGVAPA